MDRLARNLQDLLSLVEQVLNAGASVRFHKENLTFSAGEQADPFQKLKLQMIRAVAEFERSLIKQRQAKGIAIAKAAVSIAVVKRSCLRVRRVH